MMNEIYDLLNFLIQWLHFLIKQYQSLPPTEGSTPHLYSHFFHCVQWRTSNSSKSYYMDFYFNLKGATETGCAFYLPISSEQCIPLFTWFSVIATIKILYSSHKKGESCTLTICKEWLLCWNAVLTYYYLYYAKIN